VIDDSRAPMHSFPMGRPKQFDERIQLTLVEGTTTRIDALLGENEYRLDFIRTAIEAEVERRTAPIAVPTVVTRKKPRLSDALKGKGSRSE
jgi:hypothetical protein